MLDVASGRKWGQRGSALMRRIEKLEIPTIAAVNGFALGGGCELALSCDIILAAGPNAEGKGGAKFGQPEVGLGITPGFSGTQRLPRRVGIAKAKELIFSGKVIGAAEAEKIGLVNAVYAPEELMNGAIAMAKSFTANAPIAVKYSPRPASTAACRWILTTASHWKTSFLPCALPPRIKKRAWAPSWKSARKSTSRTSNSSAASVKASRPTEKEELFQ